MKLLKVVFIFTIFFVLYSCGQSNTDVVLKTKTGNIKGTLLIPNGKKSMPVALIIAGSGATDRDGNNPQMKNNSLKMLAEALYKNNIATLRYDKRGVGESRKAGLKPIELRFETYIEDAKNWINFLKEKNMFSEIIIIGHSEGSLIGMVAAQQKNVNKFISIAGPGKSADKLILEQLKAQPTSIIEKSKLIIQQLVKGKTVANVPQMFYALFRPNIQPYIISWFKYNPQDEIKKINKPILIIQGTSDIQVSVKDAKMLKKANPKAKMLIIKKMNHIFKDSEMDRQKNISTYSQPDLPISEGLADGICKFILDR